MLFLFLLLQCQLPRSTFSQENREVIFKIQLAALPNYPSKHAKFFTDFPEAENIKLNDGMVRIYTGHFETFQEAKLALIDVKTKGYESAYIVGFNKDIRITVDEAMEIIYGD